MGQSGATTVHTLQPLSKGHLEAHLVEGIGLEDTIIQEETTRKHTAGLPQGIMSYQNMKGPMQYQCFIGYMLYNYKSLMLMTNLLHRSYLEQQNAILCMSHEFTRTLPFNICSYL